VAGQLLYLDSSVIVKLVVPEPETKALRELLRSWPDRVSSVVARIEVERVARHIGAGAVRRARTVLSRIALVGLDEDVVRVAAALDPAELGTLDAIHLATAISLGRDLGALCAYDVRLGSAAVSKTIEVLTPTQAVLSSSRSDTRRRPTPRGKATHPLASPPNRTGRRRPLDPR